MPAVNSIANFRRFSRHTLASVSMAALLMASATAARAQSTLLDQLSVTASLTPMQEKEIGRSYTVITAEQLDQSQARYVSDVLRQVPGFAVSRSGGSGTLTEIRTRGAETRHTLVLIDGVRVGETSNASFDFGRLQIANIERIEILRGPQSAFWGADAMAGVINIITKSGTPGALTATLGAEIGTDGTRMGTAFVQGGQDNFDAAASLTLRHADGFNISSFGGELDGSTHIDGNTRFRADVTSNLQFDGTLRYARARAASDQQYYDHWLGPITPLNGHVIDTNDYNLLEELFGALGLDWQSDDGQWIQKARISAGGTIREAYDHDGVLAGAYSGESYKFDYRVGYNFVTPGFADAVHTITVGYDLVSETFRQLPSTAIKDPSQLNTWDRATHGLVGEYRGIYWNQFYLTTALRQEFNQGYANAGTYSVSGAWQIPDTGTRLHASVGTGSAKPSFYNLFGYFPGLHIGNPNLKSEHSFGWDFGVEQSVADGMFVLGATYFNQNLEDEITGNSTFDGVINDIGISTRQGIELTAIVDLMNGFTVGANYTYTEALNPDGSVELRRPKHMASLNAAYQFEDVPLRVHGEVVFNGETLDTNFTTSPSSDTTLPAYSTVNLGLEYKVSDSVDIYGRIENLFDTRYQEVHGYNAPGRAAFVGVKAKIQ
jgi:vitamin B12 transporter